MNKFISTIVLLLSLTILNTGFVSAKYDSSLNHPATWGANCFKIESGFGETFSIDDNNIDKVIVKGGTTNAVYTEKPFVDLTAQTNPRNGKPYSISHVIVCRGSNTQAVTVTEEEQPSIVKPAVSRAKPAVKHIAQTNSTKAEEPQSVTVLASGQTTELAKTGSYDALILTTLGIFVVLISLRIAKLTR